MRGWTTGEIKLGGIVVEVVADGIKKGVRCHDYGQRGVKKVVKEEIKKT